MLWNPESGYLGSLQGVVGKGTMDVGRFGRPGLGMPFSPCFFVKVFTNREEEETTSLAAVEYPGAA